MTLGWCAMGKCPSEAETVWAQTSVLGVGLLLFVVVACLSFVF